MASQFIQKKNELECGFFVYFEKKYYNFMIISSESVNHNLSKWLYGINIMPVCSGINLDDKSWK